VKRTILPPPVVFSQAFSPPPLWSSISLPSGVSWAPNKPPPCVLPHPPFSPGEKNYWLPPLPELKGLPGGGTSLFPRFPPPFIYPLLKVPKSPCGLNPALPIEGSHKMGPFPTKGPREIFNGKWKIPPSPRQAGKAPRAPFTTAWTANRE